jgi:isocitrate dehydrogenase
MASPKPSIPIGGEPIRLDSTSGLDVPDHPIIPFIEGDGTGPDIWRASVRVIDAAVEKEFEGNKKIAWAEVYAGEKAKTLFGSWLPEETLKHSMITLLASKGH